MTMPPLPKPDLYWPDVQRGIILTAFSNDAMRAYGAACAAAARADERERFQHITKIRIPTDAMEQEIAVHVRRAVKAEREACAKVCDAESRLWEADGIPAAAVRLCVNKIRARGE